MAGVLEYWSNGVMDKKPEIQIAILQHSITPLPQLV
jgi:hypothetical protein